MRVRVWLHLRHTPTCAGGWDPHPHILMYEGMHRWECGVSVVWGKLSWDYNKMLTLVGSHDDVRVFLSMLSSSSLIGKKNSIAWACVAICMHSFTSGKHVGYGLFASVCMLSSSSSSLCGVVDNEKKSTRAKNGICAVHGCHRLIGKRNKCTV